MRKSDICDRKAKISEGLYQHAWAVQVRRHLCLSASSFLVLYFKQTWQAQLLKLLLALSLHIHLKMAGLLSE